MGRAKGSPKPPGSGRAPGTPNKVNRAVRDMLREALDSAGGAAYLARQAEENPGPFLGLIGKLIPSEIAAKVEGTISLQSLVEQSIIKAAARQQQDHEQRGS